MPENIGRWMMSPPALWICFYRSILILEAVAVVGVSYFLLIVRVYTRIWMYWIYTKKKTCYWGTGKLIRENKMLVSHIFISLINLPASPQHSFLHNAWSPLWQDFLFRRSVWSIPRESIRAEFFPRCINLSMHFRCKPGHQFCARILLRDLKRLICFIRRNLWS